MKAKSFSTNMWILLVVVTVLAGACGNTKKKKELVKQKNNTEQTWDTVTFIETETVVEVDSIAADSTRVDSTRQQAPAASSKAK